MLTHSLLSFGLLSPDQHQAGFNALSDALAVYQLCDCPVSPRGGRIIWFSAPNWIALPLAEQKMEQKMRLNSRCLNLPLKSFASHFERLCLKSGEIGISTAGDAAAAAAAHYQPSSSSDMLWRLALRAAAPASAACISSSPSQGHTGVEPRRHVCEKT